MWVTRSAKSLDAESFADFVFERARGASGFVLAPDTFRIGS
jgi:hypothetical protein